VTDSGRAYDTASRAVTAPPVARRIISAALALAVVFTPGTVRLFGAAEYASPDKVPFVEWLASVGLPLALAGYALGSIMAAGVTIPVGLMVCRLDMTRRFPERFVKGVVVWVGAFVAAAAFDFGVALFVAPS
jgi:hypothetical protein